MCGVGASRPGDEHDGDGSQWRRDAIDGEDDHGMRTDQRNRAYPHFATHRRRIGDVRYHGATTTGPLPLGRIRGGQVLLGRPDDTIRHRRWNITVELPDLISGDELSG